MQNLLDFLIEVSRCCVLLSWGPFRFHPLLVLTEKKLCQYGDRKCCKYALICSSDWDTLAYCWRTVVRNMPVSDECCLVTWVKVAVSSFPRAVWLRLRILVSPPGVRYFAGEARDRFCAAACLDAAWGSGFAQCVAAQVRLTFRPLMSSIVDVPHR
jgi:hypothetical protein